MQIRCLKQTILSNQLYLLWRDKYDIWVMSSTTSLIFGNGVRLKSSMLIGWNKLFKIIYNKVIWIKFDGCVILMFQI